MPMIGQYMQPGHVAVGRTYQTGSTIDGSTEKFDDSLIVKTGEDGFVTSTLAIQNETGSALIRKVGMRKPTRGRAADKFSSKVLDTRHILHIIVICLLFFLYMLYLIHQHGQKGVAGIWLRRDRMPRSMRDLVHPDRASNISGQTGRLSEGHQKEMYHHTLTIHMLYSFSFVRYCSYACLAC
jgi:hypothetical protein